MKMKVLILIGLTCWVQPSGAFVAPSSCRNHLSRDHAFVAQWKTTSRVSLKRADTQPLTRSFGRAVSGSLSFLFKEFKAMNKVQKCMCFAFLLVGFVLGRSTPFWRAFRNVNDIPPKYFGVDAPSLFGKVASVSDGDTIRVYHTPLWWLPKRLRGDDDLGKSKLSDITLPVRICTIDTPETAKFGKPGQPFGNEAKEELKSLVDSRNVRLKLLQKDQYGRVVAQVAKGWGPFRQDIDEYMLKKGLAEVYTGMGAVYGPLGLQKYLEIQDDAKHRKIGIWSVQNRESAADFKKRTKA